MCRSKNFIVIAVLATVILVGGIGGIALADENENASQPGALFGALWDKVARILQDEGVDITSEQLKDAFVQAQGEMRQAALENRLAKLVEEGVIDETQADEYLHWWESRPEDVPMKFGFRGHGGFRGMGGMQGFGGSCAPAE